VVDSISLLSNEQMREFLSNGYLKLETQLPNGFTSVQKKFLKKMVTPVTIFYLVFLNWEKSFPILRSWVD